MNQVFFALAITVQSAGWQTVEDIGDPDPPTLLIDAFTAQGGAVLGDICSAFDVLCVGPQLYLYRRST